MWLKDYGINIGETILINLTRIYRNKNGKLVADATTQNDFQEIQFNIKEDYANNTPGLYNLTCNNKSNNGFPFVELHKEQGLQTGKTRETKELLQADYADDEIQCLELLRKYRDEAQKKYQLYNYIIERLE